MKRKSPFHKSIAQPTNLLRVININISISILNVFLTISSVNRILRISFLLLLPLNSISDLIDMTHKPGNLFPYLCSSPWGIAAANLFKLSLVGCSWGNTVSAWNWAHFKGLFAFSIALVGGLRRPPVVGRVSRLGVLKAARVLLRDARGVDGADTAGFFPIVREIDWVD
jgi:hypothetical protein